MTTDVLVQAVYVATLGFLSIFGLHRLYLVILFLRRGREPEAFAMPGALPRVTVQLPVYNERYVVGRLLDAVQALRYPRDRIQIQVLDDSDDDTVEIVARRVAELQALGWDACHLRRPTRAGFKAGALRAGLERASGELLCVFDADFVPGPDFLERTVPAFADPAVGMVQARWGHLNRDHSMLTQLQAIFLDAHFGIEHAARHAAGRFFNFNGTAGVWRREAIVDAGGWQSDTLTEDLDISYRAQLAGWRFRYLDATRAPAELPVSVEAFKGQQRRWTRGAVETARKLLAPIWRSTNPLAVKVEATFHLTSNLAYPAMVLLSLVAPFALAARDRGGAGMTVAWIDLPVLVCATGSVAVFFLVAQRRVASPLRAALRLPALMALGAGLAIGNSLAVLAALAGRPAGFERTPKYASASRADRWSDKVYRAQRDSLPLIELAFATYSTAATLVAVVSGYWWSLPVLLLFQCGYTYIALLSLAERRVARPLAVTA